jgi:hypothetical protein
MAYRNISVCVLDLLSQGAHDYKDIADKVREYFPSAQTTHKSVASLARDFRKAGKLAAASARAVISQPVEEQLSMFPIFEAPEFQLSLI